MGKKVERRRSAISEETPVKGQDMVRTTIWLPQQIHQRLKQLGGAGGASEAIRKRLEASFEAEKVPAKTQELLDAITYVAGETATFYGNWFEDPFAWEVLKECAEALLAIDRPKGEAVVNSDHHSDFAILLWGTDVTPKDISRIFVSDVMRKAKRQEKREERRR
jgi:hypothetical protein